MVTYYRIIIASSGETVANSLPTKEIASEVLHFKQLDYPTQGLEIESYSVSQIRPGLGRDPDLH